MKRNKKRNLGERLFKEELVDWNGSISFSKISAEKHFKAQ